MKTLQAKRLTVSELKRNIKKIDDHTLYTAPEIEANGFLLNPSTFQVYLHIKRGDLEAIAQGTEKKSLYFVSGRALKKYIKKTYPELIS